MFDRNEKLLLACTFAALTAALLINLGIFPLYHEEPRRALIALEMLYSGNFIVPTEMGEFYYKKPPVFNWLLLASYKIFGEGSEWAVRMMAVVPLLLMGGLTWWFAKRHGNNRLAVYAALFFLISGDIFFYFSMCGEIDLFYSLVTFASFVSAYHFFQRGQMLLLFVCVYALSAIGALTKGLPSLMFPAVTLSALFLMKKKPEHLLSWQHAAGILCFAAVIGAYLVAYSFYNAPANYFSDLWTQSSRRTVLHTGFAPLLRHVLVFPFVVVKDTLPVSLFLVLLVRKNAWRSVWENDLLRYCTVIFSANILLYWLSPGTRSRYLYMMYPLLTIVATHLLLAFGMERKILPKVMRLGIMAAATLLLLCSMVFPFAGDRYHFQHPVMLAAISFGLTVLFLTAYLIVRKPVHLWLALLVILCRLLFDIVVLPVRTRQGEHVVFKRDAEKIAEITRGNDLYLYRFRGDGTYPLGNVFYLERARRQTLRIRQEHNCHDYFIVYADEPGHEWHAFYAYSWRGIKYYLVKFKDCRG